MSQKLKHKIVNLSVQIQPNNDPSTEEEAFSQGCLIHLYGRRNSNQKPQTKTAEDAGFPNDEQCFVQPGNNLTAELVVCLLRGREGFTAPYIL